MHSLQDICELGFNEITSRLWDTTVSSLLGYVILRRQLVKEQLVVSAATLVHPGNDTFEPPDGGVIPLSADIIV